MKEKPESSEFTQGNLFDENIKPSDKYTQIAFPAIQQIQRLRYENRKEDALSIIKEWIL